MGFHVMGWSMPIDGRSLEVPLFGGIPQLCPQRNLITNQPTCQLSHHRCTDVLGELGAARILLFDALRLSVLGLFVNVLRSPTLGSTGK